MGNASNCARTIRAHRRRGARHAAPLLLLVAAVFAAGCNDTQKTTTIDVTGRWQSEIDESVMSIEESGLFAMDIPGERQAIIGTVAVAGTQVSFRNRPETKLCVDDDGIYEIEIVDDRLIATVVRDTCPSRVLHMSRPWRRLNAERNPSNSAR